MKGKTASLAGFAALFAVLTVPVRALSSDFVVSLAGYAESSPSFVAARRLEASGRVDEAVRVLDSTRENRVECAADRIPAGAVDFLAGRMFEKAGRPAAAVERFRAAASSPLGDMASYQAGVILLKMRDIAGARSAFGSVSHSSTLWVPARIGLSETLLEEGRPSAAVSVLEDVLDGDLQGSDLADVRLKMAAALKAAGDLSRAESLAVLAYFTAPDSSRVEDAARLLSLIGRPVTPLLKMLRRASRGDRADLKSVAGMASKGASAMARLDPGLPAAVRAAAWIAAGRDPDKALKMLTDAAAVAVDPNVRAWIYRLRGDAYVDAGDDGRAAESFAEVVDRFPLSPYALEAGSLGARAHMRAGAHDRAIELLKNVRDRVPICGGANTSRWDRALAALMVGRYAEALSALDELVAAVDRGEGVLFGLAERARYFRGVVLFLVGRPDDAFVDLRRVGRGAEYSWYGVLARSRLAQWYGDRFVSAASLPHDAGRTPGGIPARFPDAAFRAEPEPGMRFKFRVSDQAVGPVMLYKLGDRAAAMDEMSARARWGLLGEEGLRMLAVMKAGGSTPKQAMKAAAWLRGEYSSDTGWLSVAAYPRPFADDVDRAAETFDVDPALVYGVMRAESSFNPSARSPAGASGLMQLMKFTARAVSSRILGPAGVSTGGLWQPSGNIMLGTALLDRLITHFDGHLPLVLTGYNAGSGAARRIWKKLKHLPTDVFVEAVPYLETREYIRKVVGYAAAYRYLYGNSIPLRIPMSVPSRLGPWLEGGQGQTPVRDVSAGSSDGRVIPDSVGGTCEQPQGASKQKARSGSQRRKSPGRER